MTFDVWQRWGVDLDDVSFANAWAALGLADDYEEDLGRPRLRSIDEVKRTGWGVDTITWSFPSRRTRIDGTPEEWAQAWGEAYTRMYRKPVRLRVVNAPPDEPIRPWYRLLREANPAVSVSLAIDARMTELHMGWPLRLGCISEQVSSLLDSLQNENIWPSSRLTRPLRLNRDQANCDVLVHRDSAQSLLRELLGLPSRIKANIVMLHGGDESEWGQIETLLTSILAETRASGFVLMPRTIEDHALVEFINQVVRELSHGQPLDVAVEASVRHEEPGDVVAGFTSDISEFRVPELVELFNERLAALPPGTTLNMSGVGHSNEWLAKGVEGAGFVGGMPKAALPALDDRHVEARSIRMNDKELVFDHEDQGSTALAAVSEALASASTPPEVIQARAARYLQQQSFVRMDKEFREAKEGFVAGVPAMVRVRIAEHEEGWDASPSEFPVEQLPQHLERWKLTVWLSEPDHLPTPIKRQIKLPRDGNSTECEFHFRPGSVPRFEGRLTVLHRGRVIQTAILRAAVLQGAGPVAKDGAPKLEEQIAVRRRLGELDQRRQYDLAFVANHDAKGRPLLTAVSANAAWVKDLSQMPALAAEINKSLSPVAKSVQDYAKGLDGKKGEALLVQLAQHGGFLKLYLDPVLDDPANNGGLRDDKYIQIVSTRADAVVPLEFVYDYTVPEDGAKVCPSWRDAVKTGKCKKSCDHSSGKLVCPMGFWGISKVIERHALTPGLAKDGNILYLQSETSRDRDTLHVGGVSVLGSSKRVPEANVTRLKQAIERHCGVEPKLAKDWDNWETFVKEFHPSLLVALPHTGGKSTNVTVEIGNGKDVKTISLRDTHVFPPPVAARQAPLVALIGCDVAGTADDYGNHVVILRARGAAIVIGTIATVFGEHAAQVAEKLIEGLLPKEEAEMVRLGELITAVRRNSLLDGLLMPLCLVAYGDADWIIARKEAASA